MGVTAWKTFASFISDDGEGGAAWAIPSNAASDDGSYAEAGPVAKFGTSEYLAAFNLNITRPVDQAGSDTVFGIEFRAIGKTTETGAYVGITCAFFCVGKIGNGNINMAGPQGAALVDVEDYVIRGGPTDNCLEVGEVLTWDEFLDSNTSIAVRVSSSWFITTNVQIDSLDFRVYHSGADEEGGGETGELAGSTALTLTSTGALRGSGKLTGASSVSLAPTGTVLGAGKLTGSSSLTFTPTAALTGTGVLAGTTSLQLSPAGALAGAGVLAGLSTLDLATSGTLLGSGALSSQVAITFAASGTLSGAGSLAGTTDITLLAAATLGGTVFISGTASLSFAASGSAIAVGAIAGACTLTIICSGRLRNGSQHHQCGVSGTAKAYRGVAGTVLSYRGVAGTAKKYPGTAGVNPCQ